MTIGRHIPSLPAKIVKMVELWILSQSFQYRQRGNISVIVQFFNQFVFIIQCLILANELFLTGG